MKEELFLTKFCITKRNGTKNVSLHLTVGEAVFLGKTLASDREVRSIRVTRVFEDGTEDVLTEGVCGNMKSSIKYSCCDLIRQSFVVMRSSDRDSVVYTGTLVVPITSLRECVGLNVKITCIHLFNYSGIVFPWAFDIERTDKEGDGEYVNWRDFSAYELQAIYEKITGECPPSARMADYLMGKPLSLFDDNAPSQAERFISRCFTDGENDFMLIGYDKEARKYIAMKIRPASVEDDMLPICYVDKSVENRCVPLLGFAREKGCYISRFILEMQKKHPRIGRVHIHHGSLSVIVDYNGDTGKYLGWNFPSKTFFCVDDDGIFFDPKRVIQHFTVESDHYTGGYISALLGRDVVLRVVVGKDVFSGAPLYKEICFDGSEPFTFGSDAVRNGNIHVIARTFCSARWIAGKTPMAHISANMDGDSLSWDVPPVRTVLYVIDRIRENRYGVSRKSNSAFQILDALTEYGRTDFLPAASDYLERRQQYEERRKFLPDVFINMFIKNLDKEILDRLYRNASEYWINGMPRPEDPHDILATILSLRTADNLKRVVANEGRTADIAAAIACAMQEIKKGEEK